MSAASLQGSSGRIWLWPALIAVLTVFGLLAALLGQSSVWSMCSWIALAVPLAVIICFVVREPARWGEEKPRRS